jgi:lipopolysaccharide transport system ATP-binding protein
MYDLRDSGTTVLFVSHSMGMVQKFCTEAILIHQGRLISSGSPDDVAGQYQEIITSAQAKHGRSAKRDAELDDMLNHEEEEDLESVSQKEERAPEGSQTVRGTGVAEIESLELLDESGNAVNELPSGSALTVRAHLHYTDVLEDSVLNLNLHSKRARVDVFATNNVREGIPLGRREGGDRVAVDFTLETPLKAGAYVATVTVAAPGLEKSRLDRVESSFKIIRPEEGLPVRGLVRLPVTVKVRDLERQQTPGRST